MSELLEAGDVAVVEAREQPTKVRATDGELVRWLMPDGTVSAVCTVVDTTLRNNRVVVTPEGTNNRITVNRRRLLPKDCVGATTMEVGDRYKVMCPTCGGSIAMLPGGTEAECPAHGKFPLQWLGVKPMNVDESNTGVKEPKAPREKPAAAAKAPKAPKEPKPAKEAPPAKKLRAPKEAQLLDLATIASLGELYTKTGLDFDHPHVTAEAHVLLVNGRKYCFNTYNGSLGKRAKDFDISQFQDPEKGFAVKDMAKQRKTLENGSYRLVSPTIQADPPDAQIEPAAVEPATATIADQTEPVMADTE